MKTQQITGIANPHKTGNIVPKPSYLDIGCFAKFVRSKQKRKAAKQAKRARKINR